MKPTKKQISYISFIEEETGVVYNGKTKQDASNYISKNKDKIPFYSNINTWSIINGY